MIKNSKSREEAVNTNGQDGMIRVSRCAKDQTPTVIADGHVGLAYMNRKSKSLQKGGGLSK